MEHAISPVTVEEIERALCEVAEIKAARIVASGYGAIQEIHVVALPTKAPKQLVRDIESTVMARFGIPIDHKKVSIAQLGHELVPKAEAAPVRAKIKSINLEVTGVTANVTVVLDIGGEVVTGEGSGPASQTSLERLIALATLDAIGQNVGSGFGFALEDVSIIMLGRERVAVCCIVLVSPLGEQSFTGSALVRQNDKDSIVRATLDAINRRMGFLTAA